jgi:hypothetical protein
MFAYSHVQQQAWGHLLSNPLAVLFVNLFYSNLDSVINAVAIIFAIILLIIGYKKIPFEYFLFSLLLFFGPSFGNVVSSWRYISVLFPLFLIMALYSSNEKIRQAMLIGLVLLQGFFMVFWAAQYWFVV